MAKSRKQKLKVKDFQKKKLKVGKAKPKASNVTDTSFVSKTISIRNQHLGHDGDLTKRMSLLKHHNSTVKKETLQSFQKVIPRIISTRLMTPLLTQSIPLICEDSRQTRSSLIDLINEIGSHDAQVLKLHCKLFVLYINMAMTHIMPSIQADSSKFLSCMLRYCGEEICSQSFVKLLVGLFAVLGWGRSGKNQNAGAVPSAKRDAKQTAVHLVTLYELIKCGCTKEYTNGDEDSEVNCPPNQHLIPNYPQPYENLKIFARQLQNKQDTTSPDLVASAISTQDIRARQTIVKEQFLQVMIKHCDSLIKDGGECGKWSNNLSQLLQTTFNDL